MTQAQLDQAIAACTGEQLAIIRHHGFSLLNEARNEPAADDIRLVVHCPFCGDQVPYPGRASGPGAIFNGTPYANLMTAYLVADVFGTFGPGTVSFAGLTPGDSYRLILYSAANSVGRVTDFTLSDGLMQSVTPSGSATFAKGDTYADFTTTANSQGGSRSRSRQGTRPKAT